MTNKTCNGSWDFICIEFHGRTTVVIGTPCRYERAQMWIAFLLSELQNNLNFNALNHIEFVQNNSCAYVHTCLDTT
jgi:hypothetical protein